MYSRSLQVRACSFCTSSSLSVVINEAWRILSHISGSFHKHWFFITCTKHTHGLSQYLCRLHDGSGISADCWQELIGKLPVCVALGSNLTITHIARKVAGVHAAVRTRLSWNEGALWMVAALVDGEWPRPSVSTQQWLRRIKRLLVKFLLCHCWRHCDCSGMQISVIPVWMI